MTDTTLTMHRMRRRGGWQCLAAALLLGCARLLPAQVVFAPEEPVDEEIVEEVRIYKVELLVFEYTDRRESGTEVFTPEVVAGPEPLPLTTLRPGEIPEFAQFGPVVPPTLGATGNIFGDGMPVAIDDTIMTPEETAEYRAWVEAQPLEEVPSHTLTTRLKLLDAETEAMPEIYRTVSALRGFRPIVRTAWTQAVLERSETIPLNIRRLGYVPLRLEGKLTLYLSRYLHLVVDLTLDGGEVVADVAEQPAVPFFGDTRVGSQPLATDQLRLRYRIDEDRIFRNGELRYYDHPRFGVLARITRVEEELPAEGETGDEAFLLPAAPPAN